MGNITKFGLAAVFLVAMASSVSAMTIINDCNDTAFNATDTYYINGSLYSTGNTCLTFDVNASNSTLDCGYGYIIGIGTNQGILLTGGASNITIEHCAIYNFQTGIMFNGVATSNNTLYYNWLFNNSDEDVKCNSPAVNQTDLGQYNCTNETGCSNWLYSCGAPAPPVCDAYDVNYFLINQAPSGTGVDPVHSGYLTEDISAPSNPFWFGINTIFVLIPILLTVALLIIITGKLG